MHTMYSMDSSMSLEQIIARCLETSINCVAITDHGTIAGAVKMQEIAPFTTIMGEEVLTASGDMIGLFLAEEIPNGLSAEETAIRIKDQGGLVCIPHPFTRLRSSALTKKVVETILPYIDIIEVFNSRSFLLNNPYNLRVFAQTHGLYASAGSDAHTPGEIGNAYVEMPEFNGRDDFLQALSQGKIIGRWSNPLVHITSARTRLKKKRLSGG